MQDIVIKELSKSYGEKIVIQNCFVTIPEGGTTVLMGPSGCGKTTFLSLLMNLQKRDGGSIEGMPDKFTAVFQENRLCEEATAYENVTIGLMGKPDRAEIEEAFKAVGIEECIDKTVNKLSGGQKRRVAILRALMPESELVIMDEPFTSMDTGSRMRTMSYVKKECEGKTLLMVTHEKSIAEYMGGDIIRWDFGV